MIYKVKESDLVGEIHGFPIEVVQKMVELQFEQTGKCDVELFQKGNCRGKDKGGFAWEFTDEDYDFWDEVIREKHFDLFFQTYPKAPKSVYPKVMKVWDVEGGIKRIRVVLAEKCGKFIAWANAETIEDSEAEVSTVIWNFAEDINVEKLTKAQIAKMIGKSVNEFEIAE